MPLKRKLAGGLILVAMLIGGLFMWAGNPYLWIRLTASQAKSQSLTMGQAVFILLAIAITGFVMVKVLAWLNALYARTQGGSDEVTIRMPWNQSLRDGNAPRRTTTTALDVVMLLSVSIALVAATIWFFFFASYASGG